MEAAGTDILGAFVDLGGELGHFGEGVIGQDELDKKVVNVKNMKTGDEIPVKLDELFSTLRR